ncbi:MAG: phosphoribosyltransferase family protein [Gammaproteobacteria bacterium]
MDRTNMATPRLHVIEIAGVRRALPVVRVSPTLSIAVLNILGDTALIQAAARALAARLAPVAYDVIMTAEAKSIPLAHALSVETTRPYIVLRKSYKSYMGDALQTTTLSITTGHEQTLFLDAKDRSQLTGRRVVLLDDVISTGSTLQGLRSIADRAGATIATVAAVCTEGDPGQWEGIVALAHLPLFKEQTGGNPHA